ncbi:MAG: prephenate dehydrogenase/arogenate dehydrogenase family protein [Planctomycetaceae bacterium]
MNSSDNHLPLFDTIVIVGVGLIGGSLARAVREAKLAQRIVGAGRNLERLKEAQRAGVVDDVADAPHEVTGADLVIVCTPVDRVVEDVRYWSQSLRMNGLITDVGSTKQVICGELEGFDGQTDVEPQDDDDDDFVDAVFIGSHPLAGSEKHGWEHSDGTLFRGRRCILTPVPNVRKSSVDELKKFWQLLGMQVDVMTPMQHDRLLAVTSHLPHAAAAAMSLLLTDEIIPLVATGFRSTARVAGGDPSVWTPIFLSNAEAVLSAIDQFQSELTTLADAIRAGDGDGVTSILAEARNRYLQLDPVE